MIKELEGPEITNGLNVVVDNVNKIDDKIRMENGLLKQENNELKTNLEILRVEYEELEIKDKSSESGKTVLEDKIDELYEELAQMKINDVAPNKKLSETDEALEKTTIEKNKLIDVVKEKGNYIAYLQEVIQKNKEICSKIRSV